MKKTKLFTRIIACVLVAVMVAGFIIPYVAAAEAEVPILISPFVDTAEDQEADESVDDEGDILGDDEDEVYPPDVGLPHGFEYVLYDGFWVVEKSDGNTDPAIMIDGMPIGYDANRVTVFVGNLETHEVIHYDLYQDLNYTASMPLEDGYYVIFAYGYAWADSNGEAYAINGGNYQYIYVGNNYDPNLYGVEFETTDGIFGITMERAPDGMRVIKSNTNLIINDEDLVYPEDAMLKKLNESDKVPVETIEPTEENAQIDDEDNENDKKNGAILSILWNALKRSSLLLIGIAGCAIGLAIIRAKKRVQTEKQAENDKYDDGSIE